MFSRLVICAGVILLSSCCTQKKEDLFNGDDLSNWDKVLFESTADPGEVFIVEDGVIKVSGTPNGYILTKGIYSNYKLHVEWRWTAEPGNSGVLLHVQEKNPEEWPLCIEAQLQHPKAGTIILIGQGAGITVNEEEHLIQPDERRYKGIPMFEESSENPPGEWNTYDIVCEGSGVRLTVNGVLQNLGSDATMSSGPIALQSEGAPIEFRNIYITPLGD